MLRFLYGFRSGFRTKRTESINCSPFGLKSPGCSFESRGFFAGGTAPVKKSVVKIQIRYNKLRKLKEAKK